MYKKETIRTYLLAFVSFILVTTAYCLCFVGCDRIQQKIQNSYLVTSQLLSLDKSQNTYFCASQIITEPTRFGQIRTKRFGRTLMYIVMKMLGKRLSDSP